MEQDNIISDVHKNREALSARHGNDVDKLYTFFKKEEQKAKSKVKNLPSGKRATTS